MKLSYKLFLSYLFVVFIGLVVLAISTAFVAPVNFSQEVTHMGRALAGMMGQHRFELMTELETSFRNALNNALIIAGVAATLAAVGSSWFVTAASFIPFGRLYA